MIPIDSEFARIGRGIRDDLRRERICKETLDAIVGIGKTPVRVSDIVAALGDKLLHRSVSHRVAMLEEAGLVRVKQVNKGRYGRWNEVYLVEGNGGDEV
ncbi:MAG: hypothetical protein H8D26_09540 [Methanomicrobia archaeon]|nr:hypothetical protein [Methanomicrobia archaeon]